MRDDRILPYFERELASIRKSAEDFARRFPAIAALPRGAQVEMDMILVVTAVSVACAATGRMYFLTWGPHL